jgi:hypothetical protein
MYLSYSHMYCTYLNFAKFVVLILKWIEEMRKKLNIERIRQRPLYLEYFLENADVDIKEGNILENLG